MQWGIIFIASACALFLQNGFNKDFISYTLTTLSIFVGLFLSLILTVFDKFKEIKVERPSHEDLRYIKTRRNFFKQFTALTSYAIILSLLCIVLLGIISLTNPIFSDSILNYPIAAPTMENILRFLKIFCLTVYNSIVMYFLLDFLMLVLYAVTSIHSYLKIEFER